MSSRNFDCDALLKQGVAEFSSTGKSDTIQSLLRSTDFPTLKYALTQARENGNVAFRQKRYKEAIEHYTQVLAGRDLLGHRMELQSQIVSTLSNRSACFLALKDYTRALQDAKECIQLDASWSKSWYRAARTLFEMQYYEDAEKVFRACLKYSLPSNTPQINVWIEKSANLAQKTKLIQRSIVDYNRFEKIEEEDLEEPFASDPSIEASVEFSKDVSIEQRKSLEQMLLGNTDYPETAVETRSFSSFPSFNPAILFQELPEISPIQGNNASLKMKKEERDAILGICNYLQLKSEASAAKRAYEQLETALPQKWAILLKRKILSHFEGRYTRKHEAVATSSSLSSFQDFHMLFLGTGCGLPLISAAQTLITFMEEVETHSIPSSSSKSLLFPPSTMEPMASSSFSEDYFSVMGTTSSSLSVSHASSSSLSSSLPITACTNLSSGATLATLRLLATMNGVDEFIHILPKRIETLTASSPSLNPYENSLKDVCTPASWIVLDPILFDEGIIGKRLLPSIRYARKTLSQPLPIVFPNKLIVYIQGCSIRLPTSKEFPFDFSCVDEFRWSPYVDWIDLRTEESFQVLTEPKAIFEFQFDGPLDDLDNAIPLRRHKDVSFSCLRNGTLNAIALWYSVYTSLASTSVQIATTRPSWLGPTEDSPHLSAAAGGVPSSSSSSISSLASYFSSKIKPTTVETSMDTLPSFSTSKLAVQWMDGLPLKKEDTFVVHAFQTPTRFSFKVISPVLSPVKLRQSVLPKWQIDSLKDTEANTAWYHALEGVLTPLLKALSTTAMPAASPVEILNVGCGAGIHALFVGRIAATYFSKHLHRPLPSFHITGIDAMLSSVKASRKVIRSNRLALAETYIEWQNQQASTQDPKKGLAWLPIPSATRGCKYIPTAMSAASLSTLSSNGAPPSGVVPPPATSAAFSFVSSVSSVASTPSGSSPFVATVASSSSSSHVFSSSTSSTSLSSSLVASSSSTGEPPPVTLLGEASTDGASPSPQEDPLKHHPPMQAKGQSASISALSVADEITAPRTAAPTPSGVTETPRGPAGLAVRTPLPTTTWFQTCAYVDARFHFQHKDLRQLRPPVPDAQGQTAVLMALAEAYGIPLGTSLERALPPLAADDILAHPVTLMLWTAFDTGLLGEGVLPLGRYAWKSLMHRRLSPTTLSPSIPCMPYQASLYALFLQWGPRTIQSIDVSPWSMQKYGGDYFALDLSATTHSCLSEPFKVFDFTFDYKGLTASEQFDRQAEFFIPIKTSGILNAIAFWYVLNLDGKHYVTNAPYISPSMTPSSHPLSTMTSLFLGGGKNAASTAKGDLPAYYFTRKQACQMVEEISVFQYESIPLEARQTSSSIHFTLKREHIPKFQQRRTPIPVFDTISSHLNQQCSNIAHSISSTLLTNTAANKMAARAALKIAADPGRQAAFAIDPQEAAWFALTFFT